MKGAIAAVSCANGKILHLVCVRSDATLGHLIGKYDEQDNLTWECGIFEGEAHPESRIAIGCRDPLTDVPVLDVVYQDASGAVMSRVWDQDTWSEIPFEEDSNGAHQGTDFAIYYHSSSLGPIIHWQSQSGTVGPNIKDGTAISVPLGNRFSFIVDRHNSHFYFLDSTNENHTVIQHYYSGNSGLFYDQREPQEVPAGTVDFRIVEDSVSIIHSEDGAEGIKSSVRLLEQWLNEDFQGWVTFSGTDTNVAPTIGFTVLSEGRATPAVCITYVNAETGDLIYLPARQGGSLGVETVVDVAKGWFQGSDPVSTENHDHDHDPAGETGYTVESNPPVTAEDAGPANPEVTAEDEAPTTQPPAEPARAHGLISNVIKQVKEEAPEWARKFCKDVLIPRATETVLKTARAGGARGHAVLAPLSNLWDLGNEPLTYKFLDGQYGGNEIQRQKVRTAIPEWSWYANITFKEAGPGETSHIKITFDPNDGSWSVIGNDATKEDDTVATMNLGWVKANNKNLPREERGVILHEFGHSLGLLHEHQSPAHGSKSVLDPEATVKFYMKDQGWTRDMVMDQVVKTYNLSDVSNFSQVDTKSIMHYYQPTEVTGGDPIDYNYVFSERDKAYMVINYPRSVAAEKKRKQGLDVTLETALKAVGITDSAPDLAKKILDIRNSAKDGDIDVGQIRRIFTKWAREKHTVKDEKLEPTRRKYMRGLLDRQQGGGENTVLYLDEPDSEPCMTDETRQGATSDVSNKARALINKDIFTRRPKLDRPDGDTTITRFTWTVVRDPAGGMNRVPSQFEYDKIQDALLAWTNVISIQFERVEESQAATADLIIVFQDINPHTGKWFDDDDFSNDSAHRSYCCDERFDEAQVRYTAATLKKRQSENWAEMADTKKQTQLYEIATYPQVPHDICYRGIVTPKTENKRSVRKGKWAPLDRSKRTLVHELGHYLGLDHEMIGFWCKLYEGEDKAALAEAAKKQDLRATVFDEASVMDALRIDEKYREIWTKNGFKTVVWPSSKDRYNLSLFHAGPHLAAYDKITKSIQLTLAEDGTTRLSLIGRLMAIPSDTMKLIEAAALQRKWSTVRKLYLKVKWAEVQATAKAVEAASDDKLLKLRRMKGMNPQPQAQPRMHAIGDTPPAAVGGGMPGPEAAFAAPMPKLKEVLWSKLSELFGPSAHSTSFLSIQSPARYLDKAEYSYKMEGIYSNFVKPVVVNEAEFRLTDQLFEPLRVVGAPNGQSLSINYEMVLNNLVPRYVSADIEIRKAREKMRAWLLQETSSDNAFFVNDTRIIGSKTNAIVGKDEAVKAVRKQNDKAGPRIASRMEVCQRLMLEYLEASSAWKSKHSKMVQDAMHVHTEGRLQMLEDAAREIANTAAVENSKLSAKYADVVVRGHLHTVRECLAQLDIKSTAEFLQDAKDSLRESALSSLYGASRVLPVVMSPMDWAEGLDTSFDPQDLSSDPEIIEMNITAKTRQLDTLRSQLSALQHNVKGDEASLRAAMDDASDTYSKTQADLAGAYQDSAKLLASRIVERLDPTQGAAGVVFAPKTEDAQKQLSEMVTRLNPAGTIRDLVEQMGKVEAAQRSMLSAGAKFSQRQTDWVRAKSATTAEQEAAVSRKIESATKELESLQLQLTTAKLAKAKRSAKLIKLGTDTEKTNAANMASGDPNKPIKLPDINDLAPDMGESAPSGGSRWIQVMITSKEAKEFISTANATEVSRGDWSVNFFGIAGGGSGNTKSSAQTQTQSQSAGLNVEISMNCTLVTVDRSSWFQPQFFSMSDAFMRNNNNMCWNKDWEEAWQKDHSKAVDAAIIDGTKSIPPAFLPCFPTGYILAKDVVIKISQFQISTVADKKFLDEKTTKGGSFLFFSTAKTTQKTSESSSSNFQMASNGMVVRIPGPQVIGYIQQMMPWDGTHQFDPNEALKPEIFLPGDDLSSQANKPKGNVGRGLGQSLGTATTTTTSTTKKEEFTVRSSKPTQQANGSTNRSHAPAPKGARDEEDVEDDEDTPNGHEHNPEEMDHAMKVLTEKLKAKLNEPGFLESLLSGGGA